MTTGSERLRGDYGTPREVIAGHILYLQEQIDKSSFTRECPEQDELEKYAIWDNRFKGGFRITGDPVHVAEAKEILDASWKIQRIPIRTA